MNCWIVLAGWTTFTSRHRLRRASAHADFELRADPWRAFYRVRGRTVIIELIGRKNENRLLINGKEFTL
jgi:hypothetical protein